MGRDAIHCRHVVRRDDDGSADVDVCDRRHDERRCACGLDPGTARRRRRPRRRAPAGLRERKHAADRTHALAAFNAAVGGLDRLRPCARPARPQSV